MTPRPRRSALYLPASNAKAIAKARSLPCDVVILDLEDAVAPDDKALARAHARITVARSCLASCMDAEASVAASLS